MQYSIVQASDLDTRLDAEFYRPIFLGTMSRLKSCHWSYLGELAVSIKSFGAYSLCNQITYRESGIPFLRAKDIREGIIDLSEVLYIDSDTNGILWKSEISSETTLLTMSGTVGNSTVATEDMPYPLNSSQDVAKIRTTERLSPYYLSVFLQSGYGKRQTARLPVGSVQQHIFLWQIEKLIIPLFGAAFQLIIEKYYKAVLLFSKRAEYAFNQALFLLLSELGLADWCPKRQLAFVKSYSEVRRAGRTDAEYFQPRYEEVVNTVKNYPGGWDTLGNLLTIRKCVEVGSEAYLDEGIPFVRVSNLSPFEITKEKFISEELYADIQHHQPKQGEILFSKDATPGIAHYLRERPPRMIPSGGILRLKGKTDKVNNEYLTLVLNSILTKEQVNRDVGGSVILHWRPDQVRDTLIPLLPAEIQTQIQQTVNESYRLRKKSGRSVRGEDGVHDLFGGVGAEERSTAGLDGPNEVVDDGIEMRL